MSLYKRFVLTQAKMCSLIDQQDVLNKELIEIKREIFVKHQERFSKKPVGKTIISDEGFDISYNRTEKITLLTNLIKQDEFSSSCITEKVTPEKRVPAFSKTEYKKMTDTEQEKIEKYLVRELNKPTLSVVLKDEK